MKTYTQMNSLTVQKVDTSITMGPDENQSRTFLLVIFGKLATKNCKIKLICFKFASYLLANIQRIV